MLKIGLPKGSILGLSKNLVKNVINVDINDGLLCYTDKRKYSFYLLKHRDIPKLVFDGILDYGITSYEWVVEKCLKVNILSEMDWCDTRISLISNADNPVLCNNTNKSIYCVTEFPNIAKKFFNVKHLSNVRIENLSGSTEGLISSICDCSIDCVETGKTIYKHKLFEEEIILHSKIVLIQTPTIDRWKSNLILPILEFCS